ncbi:MAG: hypothetical protein J6J23_02840, partial [Clostridia bacterium]|nr:hypothetical protein [Clostridia bacterium]
MYYKSRKKAKKTKWQGFLSASLFAVLGLLTFFKFASGLSNILLGIFGLMFYPLIVLGILISLGFAFNMKFYMSGKNLTYLIMVAVSLELLLHTAFVAKFAGDAGVRFSNYFNFLGDVATFESGITVGGLIASIITYPFMCLLSSVGACILFAIILTVFVALCVDYYLVARKFETSTKAKSMAERNGINDNNFSYLNDGIGGAIANVNLNNDTSIKSSRSNHSMALDDEVEESISQQDVPHIFDAYDNETLTNEVDPADGGYDLLNDDKAHSHYDPSKFSSAEEYIQYPYVPPIFKTGKGNGFTDINADNNENYQDDTENVEDEEFGYTLHYDNDEDYESTEEIEGVGDDTNDEQEYFNGEDEVVDSSIFTAGLNSSGFTDSRGRGRGDDSAFDNNPFTPFDTNENTRTTNERGRSLEPEVFESTAKSFFDNHPTQKEEKAEQIPIFNTVKPKKHSPGKGKKYYAPPTSLLEYCSDDESTYGGDYQAKSAALEQVLSSFNVDAKVTNIVRGPTVTQYELTMPYGTSV